MSRRSPDRPTTSPVDTFQLANGLRVAFQRDTRLPLTALHLCYEVGSRHEPAERCGLAHLCEHLAFQEHSEGPGHRGLVERAGGLVNGSTHHDRTGFSTILPSSQRTLALRLEARRMAEPPAGWPSGVFEAQRRVLLQERRQRFDGRAYGRSFEILHQLLYPAEHPYHRPPAGSVDGIGAVTHGDAAAFRSRYTPPRAVLALIGDFVPDRDRPEIERLFGSIPPGPGKGPEEPKPLPPTESRRERAEDRIPFARTYVAFRAPGEGTDGWYAAALLARGLALGRSSPLQRHLRDTGLAQDVQAHLISMRDASTLAWSATAAPGVDWRRLEAALEATLDNLLVADIPEPLLRRARNKALTDLYSVLQRLERRAETLAASIALRGDAGRLDREGDRFGEVDPGRIITIGRELARTGPRVVLSLVPRGEEAR